MRPELLITPVDVTQFTFPDSNPGFSNNCELGAVTVRVTFVLCVAEGAVPVTVSVDEPVAALPETVTVSVALPPVATEVGLSDAVTPAGAPLTVRLIVSGEPLTSAVEIVLDAELPCAIVKLDGLADIEKLFVTGAVTNNCTLVECVGVPPG